MANGLPIGQVHEGKLTASSLPGQKGKVIVIMGAPGAGKGTQSRLLAEEFGYPQISTGDILRQMAQQETPLGKEIKQTLADGNLVSDEVLTNVILERTSEQDCKNGYILDGFPRTLHQAELLELMAAQQSKDILLVRVTVHKQVLLKRLTGRRTCPTCGEIYNIHFKPPKTENHCDVDGSILLQRGDDNETTVENRLHAYIESTTPLFEYYNKTGRLVVIDGEQPVTAIFQQIRSMLV